MTRIGFVGLGNMGAPMCHRLIQAGHQVHVFDADPDKTAAASLASGYLADAARAAFTLAAQRYGAQAAELHVAKRIEDDAGLSFRLPGDWTPPWEQTDPSG
jgi:3-hydroxyisobutyrate dehydrogenase-like beta-hydroxyacid dehydrogenase